MRRTTNKMTTGDGQVGQGAALGLKLVGLITRDRCPGMVKLLFSDDPHQPQLVAVGWKRHQRMDVVDHIDNSSSEICRLLLFALCAILTSWSSSSLGPSTQASCFLIITVTRTGCWADVVSGFWPFPAGVVHPRLTDLEQPREARDVVIIGLFKLGPDFLLGCAHPHPIYDQQLFQVLQVLFRSGRRNEQVRLHVDFA